MIIVQEQKLEQTYNKGPNEYRKICYIWKDDKLWNKHQDRFKIRVNIRLAIIERVGWNCTLVWCTVERTRNNN